MERSRREFLVEGGMASLYALGSSRSAVVTTRVAFVGTGIRCLSLHGLRRLERVRKIEVP